MDTRQQDIKVEQAKASIVERIDELSRRARELRHKLEVQRYIVQYPWIATGGAFAVGALLGLLGGGGKKKDDSSAKKSAIGAAIGALVTAAVKELVMSQLKHTAKTWIDGGAHEQPAGDSFVEH